MDTSSLPPPEAIRRIAGEILQQEEFRRDAQELRYAQWLRDFWNGAWRFIENVAEALSVLAGVSPVLFWCIMAVLFGLAVLLAVHIVYAISRALRRYHGGRFVDPLAADTDRLPQDWERLAHSAADGGDFVSGIRYLFRACVARLEKHERRRAIGGLTNRQYLRRYRSTPFFQPLELMVNSIDAMWYGGRECLREDFDSCLDACNAVRSLAESGAGKPC